MAVLTSSISKKLWYFIVLLKYYQYFFFLFDHIKGDVSFTDVYLRFFEYMLPHNL